MTGGKNHFRGSLDSLLGRFCLSLPERTPIPVLLGARGQPAIQGVVAQRTRVYAPIHGQTWRIILGQHPPKKVVKGQPFLANGNSAPSIVSKRSIPGSEASTQQRTPYGIDFGILLSCGCRGNGNKLTNRNHVDKAGRGLNYHIPATLFVPGREFEGGAKDTITIVKGTDTEKLFRLYHRATPEQRKITHCNYYPESAAYRVSKLTIVVRAGVYSCDGF